MSAPLWRGWLFVVMVRPAACARYKTFGERLGAPHCRRWLPLGETYVVELNVLQHVQRSSDAAIPSSGAKFKDNGCALPTHSKITKAMITFMRGILGICVCLSLPVDAAPAAVRQTFMVTAQVRAVDCTTRPVKIKACAPVVVTTDTPQTGNVMTPAKTVLFY